MNGYTKLFGSIVASTIWREDDKTRIVWITMLAMSNKQGEVEGSIPGLADLSRVTVDECRAAIAKLESPDPDSRSKDEEGRRILPIDGGWKLVNHAKYRAKLNAEDRRNYLAQKQAEFRARRKQEVNNGKQKSTPVTVGNADETPSNADPASPWLVAFGLELPESLRTQNCLEAVKLWLKHKGEKREAYKPTGLKASLTKWGNEFTAAEFPSAVENAIAAGWKGIYRENKGFQIRKVGSGGMESGRELNDTSLEGVKRIC